MSKKTDIDINVPTLPPSLYPGARASIVLRGDWVVDGNIAFMTGTRVDVTSEQYSALVADNLVDDRKEIVWH